MDAQNFVFVPIEQYLEDNSQDATESDFFEYYRDNNSDFNSSKFEYDEIDSNNSQGCQTDEFHSISNLIEIAKHLIDHNKSTLSEIIKLLHENCINTANEVKSLYIPIKNQTLNIDIEHSSLISNNMSKIHDLIASNNYFVSITNKTLQKCKSVYKNYTLEQLDKHVNANNESINIKYIGDDLNHVDFVEFDKLPKNDNTPKYMNIGDSNHKLQMRLILDNDINFDFDNMQYTRVYYDIETYNLANFNDIPSEYNAESRIGIISMVIVDFRNNIQKIALIESRFNIQNIPDITVFTFETEYQMCNEFFLILSKIQQINFVIGFASNSTEFPNKSSIGYDLPFLYARSSFKLTPQIQNAKFVSFSQQGKQISKFAELPRSYFLDFRMQLINNLMPSQRNAMNNFKLESFAKLYNLVGKDEIESYAILQKTLSNGCDIAKIVDIIKYCVQDSMLLNNIESKASIINKLISFAKIMNIPISWALYKTVPKCLELYVSRIYIKRGYLVSFDNLNQSETYKGAHTWSNNNEINIVKCHVTSLDFKSLYPSLMLAYNLSSETINNPNSKNVQTVTIDDDDKIETFTIDQNQSILSEIIRSFLNLRDSYKSMIKKYANDSRAKVYENLQYSVKIAINSLYGAFASKYFSLYDSRISKLTTYFGRKAIQLCKNLFIEQYGLESMLLVDTDSIMASFPNSESVNEFIQKCHDELKYKDLVLQNEGIREKYMLSKCKKSYSYIENDKLVIKGISWSIYSGYIREQLSNVFKNILTTSRDINTICQEFQLYHYNRLKSAISSANLETITEYAQIIKSSSKMQIAIKCRQLLPNYQNDRFQVMRIYSTAKNTKVSDIVYPIELLDITQIDVNHTISFICRDLIKMLDFSSLINAFHVCDQSSIVQYRQETYNVNSIIRTFHKCAISEYVEILKNALTKQCVSYHEIFNENTLYKLFVDIDKIDNFNDYNKFMIEFQNDLNSITDNKLIIKATLTPKNSTHIITNLAMSISEMKTFMQKYAKKYSFIDLHPYNNNSSLRSINCVKITENGPVDSRHLLNDIEFSILTNTENCIIFNKPFELNSCKPFKISSNISIYFNDEILSACKDLFELHKISTANLTISKSKTNRISANNARFYCNACKKEHKTNNPCIYVNNNNLILRCSRGNQIDIVLRENIKKIDYLTRLSQSIIIDKSLDCISERYISQETISNAFTKFDTILLKSALGTGKSYSINQYIESQNFDNIITLSFRQSFAAYFAKTYNFTNYKTIKNRQIDIDNYKRLIIQIDSLERLTNIQNIDLLIIDETMSILLQLTSHQIENTINVVSIFTKLINAAKRIIFMDGCLNFEMAQNLMSIFPNRKYTYIQNICYPNACKSILNFGNIENYCKDISDSILSNAQMSKDYKAGIFVSSIALSNKLFKHFNDNKISTILFNGDSCNSDVLTNKIKFENDPNIVEKYQIIIYTSSISAGVSWVNPIDDFYVIYSAKSCKSLEAVQASYRFRNIKNPVNYFIQMGDDLQHSDSSNVNQYYSNVINLGILPSQSQKILSLAKSVSYYLDENRVASFLYFMKNAMGVDFIINSYEKTDLALSNIQNPRITYFEQKLGLLIPIESQELIDANVFKLLTAKNNNTDKLQDLMMRYDLNKLDYINIIQDIIEIKDDRFATYEQIYDYCKSFNDLRDLQFKLKNKLFNDNFNTRHKIETSADIDRVISENAQKINISELNNINAKNIGNIENQQKRQSIMQICENIGKNDFNLIEFKSLASNYKILKINSKTGLAQINGVLSICNKRLIDKTPDIKKNKLYSIEELL